MASGTFPSPAAQERRLSREDPVVITCSTSGAVADRDQCPAIPSTPAEYAAEARRAVDEGAAMIHIHARDARTGAPSYEVEDFRAITEAILAEVGDVVINHSASARRLTEDVGRRAATVAEAREVLGTPRRAAA